MASNELKKIVIEGVQDFDPDDTFDCGQCFRWNKQEDGSWSGVVGESIANIKFEDGGFAGSKLTILSNNHSESAWMDYLDLHRDYGGIKEDLTDNDPVMSDAISASPGIRILHQDKWEMLVSFIISQNSNIPRIRKCIEIMCEEFGEEHELANGQYYYSFPTLETLAELREDDLRVCRLGYRAKYIAEAARQVNYDQGAFLSTAESVSTEELENYLLNLSGIGPKVANCIMLFAMRKYEVFPVDVWIRRVMNRLYGIRENDLKGMLEYAKEHFGRYGGIAQQYLFNYMRKLPELKPALYKSLKMNKEF